MEASCRIISQIRRFGDLSDDVFQLLSVSQVQNCHCIAVSLKPNFLPENLPAFTGGSGTLWMHMIEQTDGLWVNDRGPNLIIKIVNHIPEDFVIFTQQLHHRRRIA